MTDPTINLPEKHGSVVDVFLNLMMCFNMIIQLSIPMFENGANSAAILFRKINSGISREVSLKWILIILFSEFNQEHGTESADAES